MRRALERVSNARRCENRDYLAVHGPLMTGLRPSDAPDLTPAPTASPRRLGAPVGIAPAARRGSGRSPAAGILSMSRTFVLTAVLARCQMGTLMTRVRLLLTGLALCLVFAIPAAAPAAAPTDPQTPTAADSPLQIMRVPQALDRIGRPLQDITVAIPDTGIDLDHPDLQPRLFSLPQAGTVPDAEGERTPRRGRRRARLGLHRDPCRVRGPCPGRRSLGPERSRDGGGRRVGAAWNNGQGGAGVAPNARILALRRAGRTTTASSSSRPRRSTGPGRSARAW